MGVFLSRRANTREITEDPSLASVTADRMPGADFRKTCRPILADRTVNMGGNGQTPDCELWLQGMDHLLSLLR
jgi:hypothetical protein